VLVEELRDRRGGGRSGERGGIGGDAFKGEGGEGGDASYADLERLNPAGGLAMPTRCERGVDFSGLG
jgi:hypothetical protein